jgi:hypothetical protein
MRFDSLILKALGAPLQSRTRKYQLDRRLSQLIDSGRW